MTYWIRVTTDPTELLSQLRLSADVADEGGTWLVTGPAEVLRLGRLRSVGCGTGEPPPELAEVPQAALRAARSARTASARAAALDALLGEVDQHRVAAASVRR